MPHADPQRGVGLRRLSGHTDRLRARWGGEGAKGPRVAAIRAYHEDWLNLFPGLRIEVESVQEQGDRVLAVTRLRGAGAGSGATTDVHLAILSTYRGDRVVRVEEYLDPDEARSAFGPGID